MGGTTLSGWPYVTPDDHPLQYPAASQALANKLETHDAAATEDLAAATGLAVSLTATDQLAAQIESVDAGNWFTRPRLAVCIYTCTFNGTADSEGIFSLQVRTGSNAVTLAYVTGYQTTPTGATKRAQISLTLPFIMSPSTGYVVRVMARMGSGSGSVFADQSLHKLQRILI